MEKIDGQEENWSLSRGRGIWLIILIGASYIVWGSLISLQPPFYPKEAEAKGASSSQSGFVFGISNLVALLTAPVFGAYGNNIGAKYVYNFGTFVQAIAAIGFGFLTYIENLQAFLGLSYFLRFLNGIAEAATFASILSILMVLYPERVSMVVATTECMLGLGYALGPSIGSALYKIGGFGVPFWTMGSIGFISAILIIITLPPVNQTDIHCPGSSRPLTIKGVFKSPLILLPLYDNFMVTSGVGFLEGMLELHMMKTVAGANEDHVGIAFLLLGGAYLITTVFAGWVCDKIEHQSAVSLVGSANMGIVFMFNAPIIGTVTSLSIRIFYGMNAMAGIGLGLCMVSTFSRCQKAALNYGYFNNIETYLIISGLWTSSYFMGNFIGPTLGGILVDYFGFKMAALVLFIGYSICIAFDTAEILWRSLCINRYSYNSFLDSSS